MSETKVCFKCHIELPRSEFYSHKQTTDGLRGSCKACMKAQSVSWQKSNPDKVKAIQRRSHSKNKSTDPDKLDRKRARCRIYMRNKRVNMNPEEKLAESYNHYWSDPDRGRRWSRTNQRHRRAAIRGSTEHFTEREFQELCGQYGNKCLACGVSNIVLSPDHVKPLSRGGDDSIGNIQPLCRFCNQSKCAKEIDYRNGI